MAEQPILILGRTGQLAVELAKRFRLDGIEFCAYGRPDIDISEPGSVAKAIDRTNARLVINAAAYTAVDQAESEPEQAFSVNGNGSAYMAEACAQRDLPLIHISTDYVFNGAEAAPYTESSATNPIGVYGRSKLAGERAILESDCKSVILRTAWVYSSHGKNFVKTMLRLAETRDQVSVVNDQIGTPTHAGHLAHAIAQLIPSLEADSASPLPWGVYHSAGQGRASWADVARQVFELSGELGGPIAIVRDIPSSEFPTPVTRPANSQLDCGKLEQKFGISLPHWTVGVSEVVNALINEMTGNMK